MIFSRFSSFVDAPKFFCNLQNLSLYNNNFQAQWVDPEEQQLNLNLKTLTWRQAMHKSHPNFHF